MIMPQHPILRNRPRSCARGDSGAEETGNSNGLRLPSHQVAAGVGLAPRLEHLLQIAQALVCLGAPLAVHHPLGQPEHAQCRPFAPTESLNAVLDSLLSQAPLHHRAPRPACLRGLREDILRRPADRSSLMALQHHRKEDTNRPRGRRGGWSFSTTAGAAVQTGQ